MSGECPVMKSTQTPGGKARDQEQLGQTEEHQDEDCGMRPKVFVWLCHRVEQPALWHLRDWTEGLRIFHNEAKTFLLWVNEEDQMRIISMEKGGDVKGVFSRLARGIKAVGDSVKAESGKEFALSEQYGYIHSCPTNLGTGMRASVMIDLPGYTKEGLDALKKRCEELAVQPRGTRGESGGFDGEFLRIFFPELLLPWHPTGCTYDVSNKHRLGHSEVELIQTMIDGVNTLWEEDKALQKKHGL